MLLNWKETMMLKSGHTIIALGLIGLAISTGFWLRGVRSGGEDVRTMESAEGGLIGSQRLSTVQGYMRAMGILRPEDKLQAFDFILPDLEGKKVSLRDYRGKLVFLNFWATWCPACREEMPSMERLWRAFKDKDFVLLAISSDRQGAKVVGPFMEKFRLTFPALLDSDGKVSARYGVRAIPTTYLVDREGKVIGRAVGARDWESEEALGLMRALLSTVR